MNKRKKVYSLVGGLLATGLMLNAPSMSAYVENFKAEQVIKAANWDAKVENNLKNHTMLPGQIISEDTITLKNNNEYPVEFTISLSDDGSDLKDVLELTITDSDNNNKLGTTITLNGKTEIELNSNIVWPDGSNDIAYEGKEITYKYNITAQSINGQTSEEAPEETQR